MKKIIIIITLVIIAGLAWYGYSKYNERVESLAKRKADVQLSSAELIAAFEKDSATANKKYLGKIIEVNGKIKSIEKANNSATIVLGTDGSASSVRCSMDSSYLQQALKLAPGQQTVIKGNCTGFNPDDLGIGADVVLNRCVLTNK
jgi:hypothetical protein